MRSIFVALLATAGLLGWLAPAAAQEIPFPTRAAPLDSLLPPIPDSAFDSPATRALVQRVIGTSSSVPPGLEDYVARVNTAMQLTFAADSGAAADVPATVDEFASTVRWSRAGFLQQTVLGHRVRLQVPVPYTLGSLLESPWVIPHLYGRSIQVLTAGLGSRGTQAVNPFGEDGPRHYRYEAGSPIRIGVGGNVVNLVPVEVRPRGTAGDARLVVGTFAIDPEQAVVARARFGFAERGGTIGISRIATYLELENGLWEGRFWLPYWQRREVQIISSLLGGAVAARIVSNFAGYQLNTGWVPATRQRSELIRAEADSAATVRWDSRVGEDFAALDIRDFEDLRIATVNALNPSDGLLASVYYQRGEHLFRYNRVEGLYLGAAGRLMPADPLERRWEVYGTAGWAFAEQTPRGELQGRYRLETLETLDPEREWAVEAAAYRRLRDLRAFRPSFQWDWIYALPALFAGDDTRDYYNATGGEAFVVAEQGPWIYRLGGRVEAHDSVNRNTDRFLFGRADDFPPLASTEPGTNAALEGTVSYLNGPGVFGIGNSLLASLRGEVGAGEFRFVRATGLLSLRRPIGPFTLATRIDAGYATPEAPPQFLYRFGAVEGLSAYRPDPARCGAEPCRDLFGGNAAAIARARFLVPLPPRAAEPVYRAGFFIVPPIRPSFVLLGEAGWASIAADAAPALARIRAQPTNGVLSSVGAGVSIFDDALTLEYIFPLDERGDARWYFGLTRWF